MSDIRLFKTNGKVEELASSSVALEKELQVLIEKNMQTFFGVRFVKSEYVIDEGRMDSIGLDENNSPVIFEYKRSLNENVINQGLFYLDWLLGHKKDFEWLVMDTIDKNTAQSIDWTSPTVICVANDFTKFNIFAVNQISRNIKLVKYKRYGNDYVLFEHVNSQTTKPVSSVDSQGQVVSHTTATHEEKLETIPVAIGKLYDEVCSFIENVDSELEATQLKLYKAYKKIKNVVCVEVHNTKVVLFLKLDPTKEKIEKGFSRDVSKTGHYGTGDFELTISSETDLEKAKPIIERAILQA